MNAAVYQISPPPLPVSRAATTSAVKAGWICIVLGFLTFWTLFGMVFFSVAMVLAVVAMCKDRVVQGIVILISSLCSLGLCILIMVSLAAGAVIAGAVKASENTRNAIPVNLHSSGLQR